MRFRCTWNLRSDMGFEPRSFHDVEMLMVVVAVAEDFVDLLGNLDSFFHPLFHIYLDFVV